MSKLEIYKIAYEEGRREVDDQLAQLDSMRQRSVQFLAFVGAASAFLVGTSLHAPVRSGWFYAIAIAASALLVASVCLCISLLRGRKRVAGRVQETWEFRLSPNQLSTWAKAEVRPSAAQFYRALADCYTQMADANEAGLEGARRR